MADLLIRIKAEDGDARSALKGLSSSIEDVGKSALSPSKILGGVGDVLGKVGLAAMGAQAIFGAVSGAVEGLIGPALEAQQVTAQLQAVLASTGGKAGVTQEAVNALSTSLSRVTTFEDEAITSAQSLLLTFTNIGSDVFPQATETVLNMSQALGQDLKSSSVQLGKALNDPIKGITALSRVGVSFNDEQKEMIKTMVEAGDIAGAQAIILGELETEFGGAARAAGETFGGQLTILQNELGNMVETIGGPVLSILGDLLRDLLPLAQAFGDWLPGAVDGFMDALGPLVQQLREGVPRAVQTLVAALGPFAQFMLSTLVPALGMLMERATQTFTEIGNLLQGNLRPVLIAMTAVLLTVVVPAFVAWAAAAATAATATIIALAPVLVPLAAIGAAAFALAKAWEENWFDIQGRTAAVWAFLEPIFTAIGQELARFWEVLLPELQAAWEATTARVQVVWSALQEFLQPAIEAFTAFWEEHWATIQRVLSFVWDSISGVVRIGWELVQGIILAGLKLLQGDWEGAWDALGTALSAALRIYVGLLDRGLALLGEALMAGLDAAKGLALNVWNGLWTALQGALLAGIENMKGAFAAAGPALVGLLRAGFETAINNFRTFVAGKIAEIAALLPHSLAEEGPLSVPTDWTDVLVGNLPDVIDLVEGDVEDMGETVTTTFDVATQSATRSITQMRRQFGVDLAEARRMMQETGQTAVASLGEASDVSVSKASHVAQRSVGELARLANVDLSEFRRMMRETGSTAEEVFRRIMPEATREAVASQMALVDSFDPVRAGLAGLGVQVADYTTALQQIPTSVDTTLRLTTQQSGGGVATPSGGGGGGSTVTANKDATLGFDVTNASAPGFNFGALNADPRFQNAPRNPDGSIKRQSGGPVNAWRTYLVGEGGPELFVPTVPGRILPNQQLRNASGGAAIDYERLAAIIASAVATVSLNVGVRDIHSALLQHQRNLPTLGFR